MRAGEGFQGANHSVARPARQFCRTPPRRQLGGRHAKLFAHQLRGIPRLDGHANQFVYAVGAAHGGDKLGSHCAGIAQPVGHARKRGLDFLPCRLARVLHVLDAIFQRPQLCNEIGSIHANLNCQCVNHSRHYSVAHFRCRAACARL